jgi:hypothetical protein
MSSINYDEEALRLDKEIARMVIQKDISALESSSMEWKKKRLDAMKNINLCDKNIHEMDSRIEEKKKELQACRL